MIIFPYYCVIGGWVIKYVSVFISGAGHAAADSSYFTGFISQPGAPVFWLCLFVAATAVIVMLGVEKGVEKASKFLMPILVVLSIVIAIFVVTRDGALEGVLYYLAPDFSKFSINTVLGALGQLFYSMSLAMGIMITYGSYMKKEVNLESSVRQIEVFDTGIALLAGLMIVPAVFIFSGGDGSVMQAGPSLMFIVLPQVFDSMGGGAALGSIVGAVFFLLVFFAALTSAISLMETIVSIIQDKLHWNRRLICLIVALAAILIGIPSSLGFGIWDNIQFLGMSILDTFDFLSNSVIMPIVALLSCIFTGYVIKTKVISDEVKQSGPFKGEKLFVIVTKYVAPVCIILILISSILNGLGIITI